MEKYGPEATTVELPKNKKVDIKAVSNAAHEQWVRFQFEFVDPKIGNNPEFPDWHGKGEGNQEYGNATVQTSDETYNAVLVWIGTEERGPSSVHAIQGDESITLYSVGGKRPWKPGKNGIDRGFDDTILSFSWA